MKEVMIAKLLPNRLCEVALYNVNLDGNTMKEPITGRRCLLMT